MENYENSSTLTLTQSLVTTMALNWKIEQAYLYSPSKAKSPAFVTVTQASKAIYQCLETILSLSPSYSATYLICFNSLSSLYAISNASCNPPLVQRIHILQHKRNLHMDISDHRGILGNEDIDKAVKAAVLLPRLRPQFLPTKADLALHTRKQVYEHWMVSWQNQKNNKVASLEPSTIQWESSHQP